MSVRKRVKLRPLRAFDPVTEGMIYQLLGVKRSRDHTYTLVDIDHSLEFKNVRVPRVCVCVYVVE